MKARIGDWHIEADVTRDLASNPHRVEVGYWARSATRGHVTGTVDLSAAEAEALGLLLDEVGNAILTASDAGECELCGGPCDPDEADCPRCQEAS